MVPVCHFCNSPLMICVRIMSAESQTGDRFEHNILRSYFFIGDRCVISGFPNHIKRTVSVPPPGEGHEKVADGFV